MAAYPGGEPLTAGSLQSGLHLAIGMFDGVHVGHQAVIRAAMAASNADPGSMSGVLTFDPHPSRVLRPEKATSLLLPLSERVGRMLDAGIDRVFVQPFTREFASREASEFVATLRTFFPGLRSLYVGENFRFGAGRSGDSTTLVEEARPLGVQVGVLKRETCNGEPISSSTIRELLAKGEIVKANTMLGVPYRIKGTIVPGKKLGRGLGFPTVNLPWNPEALPRFGVYLAMVVVSSTGMTRPAIANYGLRPTVDQTNSPLLEVHLLEGGEFPTTGDEIEVSLLEFLRPERKFPSRESLREQIRMDVETARAKALAGSSIPTVKS